jgi:hypothetical protein
VIIVGRLLHRRQIITLGITRLPCSGADAYSELIRVTFMHPQEVKAYIAKLEGNGLVFQKDGRAEDIVVVDQLRGPTVPADWLTQGSLTTPSLSIKMCWFSAGKLSMEVTLPGSWKYEGSLSESANLVPIDAKGQPCQFVRHEEHGDTYLDTSTGKEVFVPRPSNPRVEFGLGGKNTG